jgi:hypothetical protein
VCIINCILSNNMRCGSKWMFVCFSQIWSTSIILCDHCKPSHISSLLNPSIITLPCPLQSHSNNNRSTNPRSILRRRQHNRILRPLLLPIQYLSQRISPPSLELWRLVCYRAICCYMTMLYVLFAADGCDTAGAEAGSAGCDEGS